MNLVSWYNRRAMLTLPSTATTSQVVIIKVGPGRKKVHPAQKHSGPSLEAFSVLAIWKLQTVKHQHGPDLY